VNTIAVRAETEAGVRSIILCRPDEYNTITPALRDELAVAIDEADSDPGVSVILLRAEGPAFCAGYDLDWSTLSQANENPYASPTRTNRMANHKYKKR
jgi:enoyl-CoA hydratase